MTKKIIEYNNKDDNKGDSIQIRDDIEEYNQSIRKRTYGIE